MAVGTYQADVDQAYRTDGKFALLPQTALEFKRLVRSSDVQANLVAVMAGIGAALGSRFGEGGAALGAIVGTVIGKKLAGR